MNPEFQGRLEVTKMHLLTALDIGKECALATVGESIYNIDLRAGQIFTYSEIGKELKQLYSEWNTIKLNRLDEKYRCCTQRRIWWHS